MGVFFCRTKWFLKVESGFLTFDKPGWYWFYPKSNFVGENQQTISSLNARQTCNQFFNMSPARNLTFKQDWTKLNGGIMAIFFKKKLSRLTVVSVCRRFPCGPICADAATAKMSIEKFHRLLQFRIFLFSFATFLRNTNQVLNDIGHYHFYMLLIITTIFFTRLSSWFK